VLRGIPMWVLWGLVVLWSLPTVGLFVSGFRERDAQRSTGWWQFRFGDLTLDNYQTVFDSQGFSTHC
jgi:alpha-glucoside transport system permease protein